MSKETRHVFKILLTPDQVKAIDDTVGWCLGIMEGEKIIAEVKAGEAGMTVVIVPPEEARLLDVAFRSMRERTEIDNLGLLG